MVRKGAILNEKISCEYRKLYRLWSLCRNFDFNEDGLSYVISQEDLDLPSVTEAIESCPVQVISLEEAEEAVSNVIPFPENKEDIFSEVEIDENEKAA